MSMLKRKTSNLKKISDNVYEWNLRSKQKKDVKKFTKVKQVSKNTFEWNKKSENQFLKYLQFIKRIKKSNKPFNLLFRFTRRQIFVKMSKEYPMATTFYYHCIDKFISYNKLIEKSSKTVIVPYTPGIMYIGPIVISLKLYKTEIILKDLRKRNISLEKILKNDDVSFKIMNKSLFLNVDYKNKRYDNFLENIENSLK